MITDLIVENFQSWEHIALPLAPITLIVGKGDKGKTALMRAMTYALTNQGGDDFIRRGKTKALVAMNINGHALIWEKAKGVGGEYDLDGVRFTKTGQTVPQEIQEATGFRTLEIDKNYSVMPNIHTQFDPPFLVFESGSRMARILGKLTKVDTLVNAQILARRELKRAEVEQQTAQTNSDAYRQRLARLPDTEALREQYHQVREAVQEADERRAQWQQALKTVYAYREAARQGAGSARLAEEYDRAFTAYAFWTNAIAARQRHASAVVEWADAGYVRDEAATQLAELEAEYAAACDGAGVCEVCPWK